ncbi:hypothetical protein [Parasutterella excrementihominis]|uniref:hypothetical protein n=1 Tax=Parasutterella excrementihominis TaxID=487175 RepID=UPI0026661794|nr:hypothetical protein [Parasutterella excrementihominis]
MKTKQNYDPHVGCLYSNLSQRVGIRSRADQHDSYRARNCASLPDEFIVGVKSMNEILEEYYVLGYLSCDTQAVRSDSAYDEIQPSGKDASILSTDPSSDFSLDKFERIERIAECVGETSVERHKEELGKQNDKQDDKQNDKQNKK